MKKLSEVCKLTGLSRRALQGYDQIGLLSPTAKTESGYCLYDDQAVKKLVVIKIFTEAGYSRERVKDLLTAPAADLMREYDTLVAGLREEQRRIEGTIRTIRLFEIESQLSDSARAALREIDPLVAYGQRDFSSCFSSLVSETSRLDCELDVYEMEKFMLFWYSLVVVGIVTRQGEDATDAVSECFTHFKDMISSLGEAEAVPEDAAYRAMFAGFIEDFAMQEDIFAALEKTCGEGTKKRVVEAVLAWCEDTKETQDGE